jgi:hypothetical protein
MLIGTSYRIGSLFAAVDPRAVRTANNSAKSRFAVRRSDARTRGSASFYFVAKADVQRPLLKISLGGERAVLFDL